MIYDRAFFDDPVNRIGTRSVKWDEQSFCRLGDLPLWVADWDFRCAEPIVEAIQKRAQHPIFGYCDRLYFYLLSLMTRLLLLPRSMVLSMIPSPGPGEES